MDVKHRYYPESRFGGFTNVDGTISFYLRINEFVEPGSVVLDVGCGRGAVADDPIRTHHRLRDFRGRCARVIGIDVEGAASVNPLIDEFRRIEGRSWPVETGSVDVAIADFVLEHVPDPDAFFDELRRVLRPDGFFGIRASNALGYVTLVSRLVPGRLHARVLSTAQPERKEQDVFPTVHRCNTLGKLRRALRRHGFDACVYGYEAEPSYLAFSPVLYVLGVLHQRVAPGAFKLTLVAYGRKRA